MVMLSPKQGHYYKNSDYKLNISEGAVRSGKTFITNLRWMRYVRKEAPKEKLLMSGFSKNTIKENVIDDIESIVGEGNPNFNYKEGLLRLYGKKIEVVGAGKADSEKAIRGRTYGGWYGDEITLHHPTFIKQAVTRNSPRQAKLFWTTNPDHPKHYVKTQFLDNPDWEGMLGQWKFLLTDNLTLEEEYIMMIKASYAGVFYKRNIEGLWVVADGLVYEDYNPDIHRIPHEEVLKMMVQGEFEYFIGGIDWGFTHPMAGHIYGVKFNKKNPYKPEYYQLAEFYKTQKQTEDLGRWFNYYRENVLNKPLKFVWADSAEPDRIITLQAKPFGLPVIKARKGIDAGLNTVMTAYKGNRIYHSDECEYTDEELQMYRYPNEDEHTKAQLQKDQPIDEDNHAMDCERYCIHNHELLMLALKEKHDKANKGRGSRTRKQGRSRKR